MTLSVILAAKGGDVVTTTPDQTLRETVRTLGRMKIGAIVVVDGERHVPRHRFGAGHHPRSRDP